MKSLSLSQPHLIVMVGIPGAGKSYFADKFAETFHAPCVNVGAIAQLVENTKKAELLAHLQLKEFLKTKQSVVIDGLGATRTERLELTRRAHAASYIPLFLWVQTDPATARDRLLRAKRPAAGPKMTDELYEKALRRFTPLDRTESPVVISGKHTYASQIKVVLKKLIEPRADVPTLETPPARPKPQLHGRRSITIR